MQTCRSIRHAKEVATLSVYRYAFCALLVYAILGCERSPDGRFAMTADDAANSPLSVSELANNAEKFDGKSVSVRACLNASPHGMSLGECERLDSPQLNIGPGPNDDAYKALVNSGFQSLLAPRTKLTVLVVGTFHKSSGDRFDLLTVDSAEVVSTEMRTP